jgi:hypothetical protein
MWCRDDHTLGAEVKLTLTSSILTGTFCSYTPDSRLPNSWQL